MSTVIAPAEENALVVKARGLAEQLAGLAIADWREVAPAVLTRSLEGSALIGRLADDYLREVEASFGPIVSAAHAAHKAAVAERDRLKAPASKLKTEAGQLGWSCNAELRRRQEEAEAAIQRERVRLQREADEAARIEQQAAQRAQDDALIAEAARLEQAGDKETARRLVEAPPELPLAPPAPVFVPPAPVIHAKVEGAPMFGEDWIFEVTNEALVPREYLTLDDVKIGKVVRAMKDKTNIPGIKAVSRPRATFRRQASA